MIDQIEKMLRENTLCVLCTEGDGKPHCSLMTYILSSDLRTLYMVSTRESKKFMNLSKNPNVSILIDTRQKSSENPNEQVASATFEGIYQTLESDEVEQIKSFLAKEHLELDDIFKNSNSVVFGIKLKSYLLLNGPVNAHKDFF